MAVLSRMGSLWQQEDSENQHSGGDIKLCVLGFMLTTDSPRLLLISAACGMLSIGLLSRASRMLISILWKKSRQCLVDLLGNGSAGQQLNSLDMAGQICRGQSGSMHICAKERKELVCSGLAVQLQTEGADPLITYEIISVCKDKPATKDSGTLTEALPFSRCSFEGILLEMGTQTCDQATSPFPHLDCSSPEEFLMFDKDLLDLDGESSSAVGFGTFGGELYEKLASMQKALQETNGELVNTMSTLSELSNRHYSSSSSSALSGKSYQLAQTGMLQSVTASDWPPSASITMASSSEQTAVSGLVWEDEFGTNDKYCPTNAPARSRDLCLWESDLHFYSGLCGDLRVEMDHLDLGGLDQSSASPTRHGMEIENGRRLRDSGCADLEVFDGGAEWSQAEVPAGPEESSRICTNCGEKASRTPVRVSGGQQMRPEVRVDVGDVYCSSYLHHQYSNHPHSPDRVPKKKANSYG